MAGEIIVVTIVGHSCKKSCQSVPEDYLPEALHYFCWGLSCLLKFSPVQYFALDLLNVAKSSVNLIRIDRWKEIYLIALDFDCIFHQLSLKTLHAYQVWFTFWDVMSCLILPKNSFILHSTAPGYYLSGQWKKLIAFLDKEI